jgi:PAS domain S-box-containing protein
MMKQQKNREPVFEYLESIAEFIPASFYWCDLKGRFINLNDRTVKAVGALRKEDVIGKTVYELYQDQLIADELQKDIDSVIRTGKPSLVEDKILDVTTREFRYFSATRGPLFNKKGELIGIMGVSIEITSEKEADRLKHENRKLEAENKLNLVIREKEAAETERLRLENAVQKLENDKHQAAAEEQAKFRQIVGQVLHDVQSPLASLKGIVEDAAGIIPEEKRVTLRQASMRIQDITQNMLVHFRNEPEAGELAEPLLVSTSLLEILSEKRFEHKGVIIDADIAKNAYFACIQIEPSQFKRMVSNVINNAVHAIGNKPDGVVTAELKINAEWVTVFIEDNGCGMSKELIDKIENNISVTSGKENGTGIGLTQVREVLQQNFGQLSINSVEGEYTIVMLKFPKILPPFWLAEDIKIAPTDTVVVLDDDPSIHGAWNSKLRPVITETPEIRVMHFSEGQEAVNFINLLTEQEKEHICLLADYELLHQDINGLQVIEQTKVKRSTLVTSHYNNAEIRERAANLRVRILPKMLAFAVTVNLIKDIKPGSKKVDMVWVDDARWFIKDWTQRFSHLNIDTYYDPNTFLEDVHQYPLDTKIILDRNYYDREGIGRKFLGDGLVIAKTLHDHGYTKLYMVTGEKPDPSIIPDYLTVVLKVDDEKIKELANL